MRLRLRGGSDTDDPDEEVRSSSQVFGALMANQVASQIASQMASQMATQVATQMVQVANQASQVASQVAMQVAAQPRRVRMPRSGAKCST